MKWKMSVRTCLAASLLSLCIVLPARAKIIYVDADAPGANNGSSWADAYNLLQDALTDANLGEEPAEIRVAQGIYRPDCFGGHLDAFVANYDGQPNTVWINDGRGNFTDSGQRLGNEYTRDVDLGDLDGDGDIDAFTANAEPDKIWLNDGHGIFTDSGQDLHRENSNSRGVELGDLDGDGDLDAFVADSGPVYLYHGCNRVWLNDGHGVFTDTGQDLGDSESMDVALGDLDGDGDLDAFVANFRGQPDEIWLNDGSGNFTDSGQRLGSAYSSDVELGDIDGDGDLDAFVADIFSEQGSRVWLNDSNGIFTDSGQNMGQACGVTAGDVDGDGDLDVLTIDAAADSRPYNDNRIWLNDGTGIFTDSGPELWNTGSADAELGRLDGDGDLDIFVTNETGVHEGYPDTVWLNDGKGKFIDSGQRLGDLAGFDVELADLTGDTMRGRGKREATFHLISRVAIRGGYAGFGAPQPNAQDVGRYETILSGEINGLGSSADNSYHVVTGSGADETAVLEGFTITGGSATDPCGIHIDGGGMFTSGGSPTVVNCIFRGNHSANSGGGICNKDSAMILRNCTFVSNSASFGGGIATSGNGDQIVNCIVWSNYAPTDPQISGDSLVRYSAVQHGWPGEGNIDADPCFADPGFWGHIADPNIHVEPNDPNASWVDGDYHLKSQAGRWCTGEGRWTIDEVTSLCIDAGDPNLPIGPEPFPNGGRINMGAYGGTAEASKSYFNKPPCETIVAGDINGDCIVDGRDFAFLAWHWQLSSPLVPGMATNPDPADGATGVTGSILSWTPGHGATSHDVYFGTISPGDFQGNQTGSSFYPTPFPLPPNTKHYWRIDERNQAGTTTGVVWSFTTSSPSR
ncbi:MAG: VCBS repeat-containing protein [Sedimentisphaerales bacterium]|nr:VCBS repeat-containing protein [Sedimentisphaerales bacterium]